MASGPCSQMTSVVDLSGKGERKPSHQMHGEERIQKTCGGAGSNSRKSYSEEQPRRYRTNYSRIQISRLEDEFVKEKYLSRPRRTELALELGLKESTIKVWFQNRRMKEKRQLTAMTIPVLATNSPQIHPQPADSDPNLYAFLIETASAYMNYTAMHGVPPNPTTSSTATSPSSPYPAPLPDSPPPPVFHGPPAPLPGNQPLSDLATLTSDPRLLASLHHHHHHHHRLPPPSHPFLPISGPSLHFACLPPAVASLQQMVEFHLKQQLLSSAAAPAMILPGGGEFSLSTEEVRGGRDRSLTVTHPQLSSSQVIHKDECSPTAPVKRKIFRPFITDDSDD